MGNCVTTNCVTQPHDDRTHLRSKELEKRTSVSKRSSVQSIASRRKSKKSKKRKFRRQSAIPPSVGTLVESYSLESLCEDLSVEVGDLETMSTRRQSRITSELSKARDRRQSTADSMRRSTIKSAGLNLRDSTSAPSTKTRISKSYNQSCSYGKSDSVRKQDGGSQARWERLRTARISKIKGTNNQGQLSDFLKELADGANKDGTSTSKDDTCTSKE